MPTHPNGRGPGGQVPDRAQACLRVDAERNRERILQAASEVFGTHGIDAPLAEVARHAQVGIATLYRRFPTRGDLVREIFAAKMTAYAEATERALDDPDPWTGFCQIVTTACQMQAQDTGFAQVLTARAPLDPALETERTRSFRAFTRLVARAQKCGALRNDFVTQDLAILLAAHAGVLRATCNYAPAAGRRLTAYLLQAFRAPGAEPLPPPPTQRQMFDAISQSDC